MKKYYPVLFGKLGERQALKNLSINVKQEITPIIKIIDSEDTDMNKNLRAEWSFSGNEVIIDSSLIDFLPYTYYEELSLAGVNVIPLIEPTSSIDHISVVTGIGKDFTKKVAVRISNSTGGFDNPQKAISDAAKRVKRDLQDVIVVFDFGQLSEKNNAIINSACMSAINGLGGTKNYYCVVVSSGAMPDSLAKYEKGQRHMIPRYEMGLWESVKSNFSRANNIRYSDYSIKNVDFNPSLKYAGSASLKYSTEKHFIIYKGIKAKDHPDGNGQYINQSAELVKTKDFSGARFSWGDKEIYERVKKGEPIGNATTWIGIGHNHHITLLHSLL